MGNRNSNVISKEALQPQVFNVRGKRVVLDREVAALVGMSTKSFNQSVKRNHESFSEEMMFQLSKGEYYSLISEATDSYECQTERPRSQIVTSKTDGRGGIRYLPYVFTAEGIQVLERVLKREIKIEFEEDGNLSEFMIENHITGTQFRFKDLIYTVRGQQVLLDSDLAEIYGYTLKSFNQQVSNNADKFEADFMFQLTKTEANGLLRSKILTLEPGRGKYSKYLPHAFTEQGAYMLMTVLKGELANRQSKMLIRMFKKMKDFISSNQCFESGCKMQYHIEMQDKEMTLMKEKMDSMVTRAEFEDIVQGFTDPNCSKDILIHNNSIQQANYAFISIYAEAHKSIYIVDNYIGVRTIELLCSSVRNGVDVTIFSENAGKQLTKAEVDMALEGRANIDIRFKHNGGIYHDRYIVLDYNTDSEKIYDCGCSSKDAGGKISSINLCENGEMYHYLVDKLLLQPELVLK